jgi:excisionase family DNA binding protein
MSKDQIYRMVREREIGSKKAGRSIVIPVAAFEAWLSTYERASA